MYTQTKAGGNLAILKSRPGAPKAKDTKVATKGLDTSALPESWVASALPGIMETGIRAYGFHMDNTAIKAKQASSDVVNRLNANETAFDTAEYNARESKDPKAIEAWKGKNSQIAKLARTQEAYGTHVEYLEGLEGLRASDKEALLTDFQKVYTKRVTTQRDAAFEERKEADTASTLGLFNSYVMPRISEGAYDHFETEEYKATLKAWGHTQAETDSLIGKVLKQNIDNIYSNQAALETVVSELEAIQEPSLGELDVLHYAKKTLDAKLRAEDITARRTQATNDKATNLRIKEAFAAGSVESAVVMSNQFDFTTVTIESLETDRESLIQGLYGSSLAVDLQSKGYSDTLVHSELSKYVDEVYLPKKISEAWKSNTGGHIPLALVPPQYKKFLVEDIKAETSSDMNDVFRYGNTTGLDNINKNFKVNAKEVSSTVSPFFKKVYSTMMSGDLDAAATASAQLNVLLSGLDKQLLDSSLDKDLQLKLQFLTEFPQDEAKIAIAKINDKQEVVKSLTELRLTKSQNTWFNNIPASDRKDVIEDYGKQMLIGHTVDWDKFTESYDARVYEGTTLDAATAAQFNTDETRDAMMYFLKGNYQDDGTYYEYEIPEDSKIELVGNQYVVYSGGAVIKAIPKDKLETMVVEDTSRKTQELLDDKAKGTAWYDWFFKSYKGAGLGGERDPNINPFSREEYYKNNRR